MALALNNLRRLLPNETTIPLCVHGLSLNCIWGWGSSSVALKSVESSLRSYCSWVYWPRTVVVVLYAVPMKNNEYAPFLINTLNTIVRRVTCWLSRRLLGRGWCRGSPAFTSHSRSLRLWPYLEGIGLSPGARSTSFRGMLRRLAAFWGQPGVSGLCTAPTNLLERATNVLICWLSCTPVAVVYLLHAAGEYCILLM